MSLAELLPAVRALTRDEKLELVRVVNEELAEDAVAGRLVQPGAGYHIGYLHDAYQAATILWEELQRRKGKK